VKKNIIKSIFVLIATLLFFSSCSLIQKTPVRDKQIKKTRVDSYDPVAVEHFLNGELYYLNNQYPQAILEYQDAIRHDSSSTIIYLQLGKSYMNMGKIEPALEALQTAKRLSPEKLEVRQLLAHLYLVSNQTKKSLGEYQYLHSKNPDNLDFSYKYAGLLLKETNRIDTVRKILNNIIDQDPDQVPALEELAKIHLERGNVDSASALFDRLVKLEPENEKYLRIRARIALGNKNLETATYIYEKLVEINPGEKQYQRTLSSLLVSGKNFQQNKKSLQQLIEQFPDETIHYLNLASLYSNYDQDSSALNILDSAALKFTENADIPYLKGSIYYSRGNISKSIEHLKKSIKINRNHTEAAHMLANSWDQKKQYHKSDSLYQALIKNDPKDAIALNNLAYSWATRGYKLDSALKYVDKALELRPNNPSYLDTKGWIYFKMDKPRKAASWIKKALDQIENGNAEIYQHLGDIYKKMGKEKEAQNYYQEAKELESNN